MDFKQRAASSAGCGVMTLVWDVLANGLSWPFNTRSPAQLLPLGMARDLHSLYPGPEGTCRCSGRAG